MKNMPENDRAAAMPGFLTHGGEMGALINACNWSNTRLGAPEGWPESLKCVLATILGSARPMYVLWGPELLFFFNSAYAPMLGEHLSGAMGQPFAQVWPELWGDFEPLLNQVLSGEESAHENRPLTLSRNGYAERTWWSFSYLPLRDGEGAVAGVHCITTETTAQVRAQESLADKQRQAVGLLAEYAAVLALDANRVLALLGQCRVVHDQHSVLVAYQGVSRPAQYLFQRSSGPKSTSTRSGAVAASARGTRVQPWARHFCARPSLEALADRGAPSSAARNV
jgi:hypothetical protein